MKRKSFYIRAESKDFSLLFSEKLAEKLGADLKLLTPVYYFLLVAAEAHAAGLANC